jgi:hypothetical protein
MELNLKNGMKLTKTNKSTRGGAREGAGRKRISADLTRRVNISIGDATSELYRQAGDGNLSEGLRRVASMLDEIEKLSSCYYDDKSGTASELPYVGTLRDKDIRELWKTVGKFTSALRPAAGKQTHPDRNPPEW